MPKLSASCVANWPQWNEFEANVRELVSKVESVGCSSTLTGGDPVTSRSKQSCSHHGRSAQLRRHAAALLPKRGPFSPAGPLPITIRSYSGPLQRVSCMSSRHVPRRKTFMTRHRTRLANRDLLPLSGSFLFSKKRRRT
jgi:hypothetical protein